MLRSFAVLLLCTAVAVDAIAAHRPPVSNDANWAPYAAQPPLAVKDVDTSHFYLTMRDGVRIAVTLYLPGKLAAGEELTSILQSTRYMRAYDLRWPFDSREAPSAMIRQFLANGYAYISVDSRGSGASFGRWPCPWSPDEVKDYGEVCDWIVKQTWSDGIIGCRGISYDGTTAELTATNLHPAIRAIAPEFSLFDAYTDVGFPGGIHLSEFTRIWSKGNALLDSNEVHKMLKGIERHVMKGVMHVDEDRDGALLDAAVASHQWNGNVHTACSAMAFKDDVWVYEPSLRFDQISPSGKIAELKAANLPIYNYSGWFDGAYANSAINRHLTIPTPGSKLVIGPWSHGGRYNSGPYVQAQTAFDHASELLRFFDFHLKGKQTAIGDEPPIHYYTMVEEKWKTCEAWPPAAKKTTYFFGNANTLETTAPSAGVTPDVYTPNYATGTGDSARWNSLMGGLPVTYPDRSAEDEKLLTYTTPPLATDTEVTGHPLVWLYVTTNAPDGQFFVYLEDVDENGNVRYVTEGELRALCRRIGKGTPPYVSMGPYRTYLREDAVSLSPGEVTELHFDLLPTSYVFKQGHSIRIAIAGADKDHFAPPYFPPAPITFLRDASHASRVELPIVAP